MMILLLIINHYHCYFPYPLTLASDLNSQLKLNRPINLVSFYYDNRWRDTNVYDICAYILQFLLPLYIAL